MADNRLQRLLGRGFSIAACVGLVIGLGILRTPGEIATTVNEPLPCARCRIGEKLRALLERGRQTQQIKCCPPQQLLSGGCWL